MGVKRAELRRAPARPQRTLRAVREPVLIIGTSTPDPVLEERLVAWLESLFDEPEPEVP